MKQTEALKLALEALKTERDIYREHDEDGAPEYILDAIAAIKEALMSLQDGAQPAVAEQHKQRSVSEQQEPAALEAVYETIIHWDEGGGKRSRRELARRIVSLYTTPQQRKPLTDEQIWNSNEIMAANGTAAQLPMSELVAVVRAVEAAHGIKENT